jgi:hypothetical protein
MILLGDSAQFLMPYKLEHYNNNGACGLGDVTLPITKALRNYGSGLGDGLEGEPAQI